MSLIKHTVILSALGIVSLSSAFASNLGAAQDNGMRFIGGEAGWVDVGPQKATSGKTRAQVQAEYRQFRQSPFSADGHRFVGGEAGWVHEPHRLENRDGRLVHADAQSHNTPRLSRALTPQERAQFRKLYLPG